MTRWLIIALVFGAAGCEEPPAIRLYVDLATDIAIPDDVDELRVSIAANSAGARVCEAETQSFDVTSVELPVYVRVVQGAEFDRSVAFWVSGWREGVEALEDQVGWRTWPEDGTRDVDIILGPGCLVENLLDDPGTLCEDDEHCFDGRCLVPSIPVVFLTTSAVQDVSCLADPEE